MATITTRPRYLKYRNQAFRFHKWDRRYPPRVIIYAMDNDTTRMRYGTRRVQIVDGFLDQAHMDRSIRSVESCIHGGYGIVLTAEMVLFLFEYLVNPMIHHKDNTIHFLLKEFAKDLMLYAARFNSRYDGSLSYVRPDSAMETIPRLHHVMNYHYVWEVCHESTDPTFG